MPANFTLIYLLSYQLAEKMKMAITNYDIMIYHLHDTSTKSSSRVLKRVILMLKKPQRFHSLEVIERSEPDHK